MPKRTRARVERSAGGVVVRLIDGEPRVLVIRDPYQNWGLPKGHLEEGEGSGEAAAREVTEETGLSDLVLGPELATIDWYFRSGGKLVHKFCAFYLMESVSGDPVPEEDEGITECVWMSLDEAAARISYDNAREVVNAAREALDQGALG
ncbi:MAG TPA: NUDIX hydrolase [Longimicrobiales bacterium]|nr:NUDIX hydrolase [Longimicrobiales bacterium]